MRLKPHPPLLPLPRRFRQGEIDDGLLTEAKAIELATRFMRGNQEACFDLAGTRQALRASAAG